MDIALIILLMTSNQPELIGILGAMDIELDLIKESMLVERVDTVSQRIFTFGELSGVPCVCAKAGLGKVNAALTAELLIIKYDVDAIIFTGVAGGINPQLNVGDIIISKRVIHHDYGQIMPNKFLPWDTLGFLADSMLVTLAQKAAANVTFDQVPSTLCKVTDHFPMVITGIVATGDQFISSESKRQWIEKIFNADCVEMEGAAVAQVCQINKIPFVIIRSLSDLANEDAEIDFHTFVLYASKNSSLIVRELLKLLKK